MLPHTFELPAASFHMRRALESDLPGLVALLADDAVSASRGDQGRPEDVPAYARAFAAIDADPANLLLVVESAAEPAADPASLASGVLAATMQLTLIPGLARVGATRLQIEAVRVSSVLRSQGLGAAMMRWSIDYAAEHGATLIQLTSDAARTDAHRFYERLGFTPSHVGFKLTVPPR